MNLENKLSLLFNKHRSFTRVILKLKVTPEPDSYVKECYLVFQIPGEEDKVESVGGYLPSLEQERAKLKVCNDLGYQNGNHLKNHVSMVLYQMKFIHRYLNKFKRLDTETEIIKEEPKKVEEVKSETPPVVTPPSTTKKEAPAGEKDKK